MEEGGCKDKEREREEEKERKAREGNLYNNKKVNLIRTESTTDS